eukprot:TRINITY_DN4657_c0_g1_i7.p1 TRINITY_DN4657_c0_g1~~TRINITY_DN4657_c0_g1_i7.p1  ORF type:complete len:177 (-),score=33.54 TRINITY_DN4657_c0_g1_i7:186-716(-)
MTHTSQANVVINEVDNVLGKSSVPTHSMLSELTYLGYFFKESMRVYPPASATGPFRLLTEPEQIGKYFLPKGTMVSVAVYPVHKNPKVWNNPEVFDMYRWTPEETAKRHKASFIPFTIGPRDCIGQPLVYLEAKIILSVLLKAFTFTPACNSVDPYHAITLKPRGGLMTIVKNRFS